MGATEITTDEFEMIEIVPNVARLGQDRHRREDGHHTHRVHGAPTHETHRVFRVRRDVWSSCSPTSRARSLREQTSHLLPLVSSRMTERIRFFTDTLLSDGREDVRFWIRGVLTSESINISISVVITRLAASAKDKA